VPPEIVANDAVPCWLLPLSLYAIKTCVGDKAVAVMNSVVSAALKTCSVE